MRKIEFYQTKNGKEPVKEYLDGLEAKHARKIAQVMKLVSELENVPRHFFSKMTDTDDLWEIRAKQGNNIFRILTFWDGSKLVIAAHGFTKKSQKTPQKEIKTAEKRKKDYFRRK